MKKTDKKFKKILLIIWVVSLLLITFFALYFGNKNNENAVVPMTFMYLDSDGEVINIYEKIHGSADNVAIFMGDEEYHNSDWLPTINLNNGSSGIVLTIWWIEKTWNKRIPVVSLNNEKDVLILDWSDLAVDNAFVLSVLMKNIFFNSLDTILWISGNNLTTIVIQNPSPEKIDLDIACTTPWWEKVEDWWFVLAYEQRTDDINTCNIEKRTCNDWVLWWSFTWASCTENNEVNFNKKDVIVYNQKIVDPLIQPNDYWTNNDLKYDTDWKLYKFKPAQTIWTNNGETDYTKDNSDLLDLPEYNFSCITPWWEKVDHGQFVKGYKFRYGFTNKPCEVQIRLCLDGNLKGSYKYDSCEPLAMSYENYQDGYTEKQAQDPTAKDLSDIRYDRRNELDDDYEVANSKYENLFDLINQIFGNL